MPFVRMIAGPNGSGKSTLTRRMLADGLDLGVYINPDDIAATLSGDYADRVGRAQLEADRIRDECLRQGRSFSFETVMSHPSKVELFKHAKALGFATFLYFVATRDPRLNIDRVALRVKLGGHDVPSDRIVARYHRTLSMLPEAIKASDCAYLYDNSQLGSASAGGGLRLAAKVEDGTSITLYRPTPDWVWEALRTLKENTGS
jgi:predicted ABC-type ATPase